MFPSALKRLGSLFLLAVAALAAAPPTPREYLGFTPGDDYKLANTEQIYGYFQKLAATSDRIQFIEFGRSSMGKPQYLAIISDPSNLRSLEHYRDISRQLALGRATPEEAQKLASDGKAIVWIDSGLHASEVAPAQHSPELAYRMVTGETPEIQSIRRNVILLQIPIENPDGLDWIVDFYRKNLGGPHETATLPWLYQKYAGHDNNRDWFMLNLPETRNVTALLFQKWFPQIVYNQHQQPPFPARIFIPPYAEPLNPNIPAAVMEGINVIGMTMKERLARENKPGVLSYWGYDAWWNGGLRSVPAFHNMHGILTEVAASGYATPRTYRPTEIPPSFANGMPTREPWIFYERPWLGGKWTLRDPIEYMLTCDFAILNHAAINRSDYLFKAWQMAQQQIEAGRKGGPFAYIVSPEQWDRSNVPEMLERLSFAGIDVHRSTKEFTANNKKYPEGTYVILAGQPFRGYLVDLLEPQHYPELRTGVNGPTKRPYDIAGWTLSMQMGVAVDRIDSPFSADLTLNREWKPESTTVLDHRENASFLAMADLLERNVPVNWSADGAITTTSTSQASPKWQLRKPRVAIYEPWEANADTGWTEWLLDRYHIPYTVLHNKDFADANLHSRFDSLILASQSMQSILHGARSATTRTGRSQSTPLPEHAGGIGLEGARNIERFVQAGGTLIALDRATELPLELFSINERNLLRPAASSESGEPESSSTTAKFYCPGSLVRITIAPTNPIAFGMPENAIAFSTGGAAFSGTATSVAKYAAKNLLASGWVSGEQAVLGRDVLVDAKLGDGHVVLFGFRPQFRGQPYGTFKLLLNAIYLASAKAL